jgi:hypothetical protein
MGRHAGHPVIAEGSEEHTDLRPQDEHGRIQPARRRRRMGNRAEPEPKPEYKLELPPKRSVLDSPGS